MVDGDEEVRMQHLYPGDSAASSHLRSLIPSLPRLPRLKSPLRNTSESWGCPHPLSPNLTTLPLNRKVHAERGFLSYPFAMSFRYTLPTTGSIKFTDFLYDPSGEHITHISNASAARGRMRAALKDYRRAEGREDAMSCFKVSSTWCHQD
jgi:hypothetical protein